MRSIEVPKDTNQLGYYGELYVESEMARHGIITSKPGKLAAPYDLIIDHDDRLLRAQIKTRSSNGSGFIHMRMLTHNRLTGYDDKDVDVFLLYDTSTNAIMVVPNRGNPYNYLNFYYDNGHDLRGYFQKRIRHFVRTYDRRWEFFHIDFPDTESYNRAHAVAYLYQFLSEPNHVAWMLDNWGSVFTLSQLARFLGVDHRYMGQVVKLLRLRYKGKGTRFRTENLIRKVEHARP